jgi:hypothetical protein
MESVVLPDAELIQVKTAVTAELDRLAALNGISARFA